LRISQRIGLAEAGRKKGLPQCHGRHQICIACSDERKRETRYQD
jgi:hypothetical protein